MDKNECFNIDDKPKLYGPPPQAKRRGKIKHVEDIEIPAPLYGPPPIIDEEPDLYGLLSEIDEENTAILYGPPPIIDEEEITQIDEEPDLYGPLSEIDEEECNSK